MKYKFEVYVDVDEESDATVRVTVDSDDITGLSAKEIHEYVINLCKPKIMRQLEELEYRIIGCDDETDRQIQQGWRKV